MKDIKISMQGIKSAKESGLSLSEYIYLCYLGSFNGEKGNIQSIEKIAELFSVSAISLRKHNAKLRHLGFLSDERIIKCVTSKGKSLIAVSLRSNDFYMYLKFPLSESLGTLNNNIVYCFISQMVKNSKKTFLYKGIKYRGYTSLSKSDDVVDYFANCIVDFFGFCKKTARKTIVELIENDYFVVVENYLIDLEFPVLELQVQQVEDVNSVDFNTVLSYIKESHLSKTQKKQLIDLLF